MTQTKRFRRWLVLLKIGLAFALTLSFGLTSASAELLDPSTLQIGPGDTTDPVRIGDTGLVTILQNQGSAPNLKNPWLLILGIPNDPTGSTGDYFGNTTSSGFTNPITSVTTNGSPSSPASGVLGGGNLYSGTWNADTGFAGDMTSSNNEVYSLIGVTGPTNNSNSFVNWAGADSTYNSLTVTQFGIYVFEINASLAAKDTVSVLFSSLPVGTFVVGYGQDSKHLYDTPFTEAGLTTPGEAPLPSPPSVVLLGLGGLGLVGMLTRSRRRLFVAT